MNATTLSPETVSHEEHATPVAPPGRGVRLVLSFLKRIEVGQLTLIDPHGTAHHYGQSTQETVGSPHAKVRLKNWNALKAALKNGDIGFAESYIAGDWSSDDPAVLIELLCRNRAVIDNAIYGSWLGQLAYRIKHWLNRNTKAQAQRNIQAHYDLGNAFYALWLDPSMTYSSALFQGRSLTLQEAQTAKYRRIVEVLDIKRADRVLEIGCGWGGFAEEAMRSRAAHVTGLTLSAEQRGYAMQRLAGLPGKADIQLTDYRDLQGQFDHIVSIEMFEAVGEAYWPAYFNALKRNLKPAGRALVQTITIDDVLFDRYRVGTDFIQQYVFPGGMLPSPAVFRREAHRAGLKVVDTLSFGRDYARTLRAWREGFMAKLQEVRALQPQNGLAAFDAEFIRLWEFYLAYCEGAFEAGNTDVMQFELAHA
jgi:cyclopropane-fatty-acyl-phospholipid synthase